MRTLPTPHDSDFGFHQEVRDAEALGIVADSPPNSAEVLPVFERAARARSTVHDFADDRYQVLDWSGYIPVTR